MVYVLVVMAGWLSISTLTCISMAVACLWL